MRRRRVIERGYPVSCPGATDPGRRRAILPRKAAREPELRLPCRDDHRPISLPLPAEGTAWHRGNAARDLQHRKQPEHLSQDGPVVFPPSATGHEDIIMRPPSEYQPRLPTYRRADQICADERRECRARRVQCRHRRAGHRSVNDIDPMRRLPMAMPLQCDAHERPAAMVCIGDRSDEAYHAASQHGRTGSGHACMASPGGAS